MLCLLGLGLITAVALLAIKTMAQTSVLLAAVAMNSIAQQAVPNGIGHSELARPQFTRKSRRVVTQLS